MKSIEELIAFFSIRARLHELIEHAEIEDGEVVFTLKQTSKRTYRKELTKVLWDRPETVYLSYLAGQMISEGYLYLPIEGGHLVVSPSKEQYQLSDRLEECTCKDFLLKGSGHRCKHLEFARWHQDYRQRIGQYKRNYL